MEFKKGDKVRATRFIEISKTRHIHKGDLLTVLKVDELGDLYFEEHQGWGYFIKSLFEPNFIKLHELEEGKLYTHGDNQTYFYRMYEGVFQERKKGEPWIKNSDMKYNTLLDFKFKEVDLTRRMKLDTLDYELELRVDGTLKVGCQTISPEDVDVIREFLK